MREQILLAVAEAVGLTDAELRREIATMESGKREVRIFDEHYGRAMNWNCIWLKVFHRVQEDPEAYREMLTANRRQQTARAFGVLPKTGSSPGQDAVETPHVIPFKNYLTTGSCRPPRRLFL